MATIDRIRDGRRGIVMIDAGPSPGKRRGGLYWNMLDNCCMTSYSSRHDRCQILPIERSPRTKLPEPSRTAVDRRGADSLTGARDGIRLKRSKDVDFPSGDSPMVPDE